MSKFKVGDRIAAYISVGDSIEVMSGTVIYYEHDDSFCVEFDKPFIHGHGGSWGAVGKNGHCYWIGQEDIAEDVIPTPQQRLDVLAKYFTSGSDVPVERATIKASDFWKIYNGEF